MLRRLLHVIRFQNQSHRFQRAGFVPVAEVAGSAAGLAVRPVTMLTHQPVEDALSDCASGAITADARPTEVTGGRTRSRRQGNRSGSAPASDSAASFHQMSTINEASNSILLLRVRTRIEVGQSRRQCSKLLVSVEQQHHVFIRNPQSGC